MCVREVRAEVVFYLEGRLGAMVVIETVKTLHMQADTCLLGERLRKFVSTRGIYEECFREYI